MDRKSIFILIVALLLFTMGSRIVDKIWPPRKVPITATNQLGATNISATTSSNASAPMVAPPSTAATMIQPTEKETTLIVSNQNLIYHFTSHGGGLKLVELRDYPAVIQCGKKTPSETNFATLNTRAPTPILALVGNEAIQGDNFYTLSQTDNTVRAEITLTNGLHVVKEFQIGTNYLLTAKLRLENTSDKSISLPAREMIVGTATAMSPKDNPMSVGVLWYNGAKAESVGDSWFANRSLLSCVGAGRPPRNDYEAGTNNVGWTAMHNQFFTLAAICPTNQPAPKIVIHKISLSAENITASDPNTWTNGFQTAFVYPAAELQPKQSIERDFTFYAGPKKYNLLAQLGEKFNNNLDLIMEFGWAGFFAKMLLLSMNGLHTIGIGYGLAIIVITVLIKLLFWPLTKASTRSMKRMQALQPQMKAIAEKYKDDPAKKNQKTMEFMKENKVSPLGGCLPMLLQIPVFFGFYSMLRSAIELRGAPFLWACDLSQSDTIATLHNLPILGNFPVNPLPLIMGVTMLWQARLTPPSPGMDPGQAKIMRYMPLMFIFILYKMQAGLTLYWTVQNILTVVQTKLTKTADTPATGPGGKPISVVPVKKKK